MRPDTRRALDDVAWRSKIRIEPQPTAAEAMTELQLRLWCLWMCEECAGMEPDDAWMYALEEADSGMRTLMIGALDPLATWELSERMAWP